MHSPWIVDEQVVYDLQDDRWIINGNQIRPMRNEVILTFDDGPSRHLNSILDILKDKQVQAMFFWQTRLLFKERAWKRILNEGHKIGAHTHTHKNLVKLTKEQQYKQIKNNIDKIQEITGTKATYFRPPFGQYNEDTMSILLNLNLTPVMWEISSFDWDNKNTPENIVCNVDHHIREGSIVLLHELEQTVQILPQMIDSIRGKGFGFAVL